MMGFYRISNGWLTLRGGSKRHRREFLAGVFRNSNYALMTVVLGIRWDNQGCNIGSAP
jgi:hypothetical protein